VKIKFRRNYLRIITPTLEYSRCVIRLETNELECSRCSPVSIHVVVSPFLISSVPFHVFLAFALSLVGAVHEARNESSDPVSPRFVIFKNILSFFFEDV